jgi:S1-C subfamily serine protease
MKGDRRIRTVLGDRRREPLRFSGAALRGVLLLVLVASAPASAAGLQRIEPSIVRILNYAQRADWYSPWDARRATQSSGSGFVVSGGLIMTNAHVVSDARDLIAYRNGDPSPYPVEVLHIAHDCDLALLRPLGAGLLADAPALRFGGLPAIGSTVVTYGYPAGGRQMASTRGVISRIENESYSHSGFDYHLAVQTDASINPGSSGGPVVQDGAVVGVAFQASPDLENVGFFIPTEVVDHFLTDVADGAYDGYPELGVSYSSLENPAARRKANLAPNESGVVVDLVLTGSSADGLVAPNDVILEIDGHAVANDGTTVRDGLRVDVGVVLDTHQTGGVLQLRLLRDGTRLPVEVTMAPYPMGRRFARVYDVPPRYYVYGGLVFVPLGRNTLETLGDSWASSDEKHLLYEYYQRIFRDPAALTEEPVLMLRRLDHSVNVNGSWSSNLVVKRVNGRAIASLEDVIEAIESQRDPYHVLEFAYYERFMVIDRKAADRAQAEILERYGVPVDRRL